MTMNELIQLVFFFAVGLALSNLFFEPSTYRYASKYRQYLMNEWRVFGINRKPKYRAKDYYADDLHCAACDAYRLNGGRFHIKPSHNSDLFAFMNLILSVYIVAYSRSNLRGSYSQITCGLASGGGIAGVVINHGGSSVVEKPQSTQGGAA